MESTQALEAIDTKTGEITEIVKSMTFTPEQVKLLKRTVCKDASDDEFAVFLNVCKKVQLDPFAKQIYAVKYKGNLTAQTSIDGLRLIADRTGRYAPGKASTFTYDKDGNIESATAYIMKNVGGQWFEVSATAFMKEYTNAYNSLWQKLPHAMLSKCAEALALRRAFPNETSGLYASEEMDQAGSTKQVTMPKAKAPEPPAPQVEAEVVESVPQEPVIEFGEEKAPEPKPEIDAPKITMKQQKMIFAVWRQTGFTPEDLKKHIQSAFGKDHTADLTRDEMQKILDFCNKEGVK